MKKFLRVLAIVLAISISLVMMTGCKSDPLAINDQHKLWQDKIADSVKIVDMVMPGSHDAGTKGMVSMAETQRHSVLDQLNSGVRYFDIRVTKVGGELKIFHSIIKGMLFKEVVEDIKTYLSQSNGQFLVLDFQHFENNAQAEVADLVNEHLNPSMYAVPSDRDISKMSMGDMRNAGYKYIITWGSKTESDRQYIHYRNDSLTSPYSGDDHKKGGSHIINNQFPKYLMSNQGNKLFVLQAVVTAENILQNIHENDEKFNPLMDNYIKELATDKDKLSKVNIIMRDFIAEYHSQIDAIVMLNSVKGNFR